MEGEAAIGIGYEEETTNADGDFKIDPQPANNSPTKDSSSSNRPNMDHNSLLHSVSSTTTTSRCHISSHFELLQHLKDVAEAKQSLIMTQQKLQRAVSIMNSGVEQQHKVQRRIPAKCDVEDVVDLHSGGKDCRYVGHNYWQVYVRRSVCFNVNFNFDLIIIAYGVAI